MQIERQLVWPGKDCLVDMQDSMSNDITQILVAHDLLIEKASALTFQFEGELAIEEEASVSSVCQACILQGCILGDGILSLLCQGEVCSIGEE